MTGERPMDEQHDCLASHQMDRWTWVSLEPGFTTESCGRRMPRQRDYSTRFVVIEQGDNGVSLAPAEALALIDRLVEMRPLIERWIAEHPDGPK